MMKFKKIFALASIVVFGAAMFAGCGSSDQKKAASNLENGSGNKTYIIACDAKYAPFSMEENGQYKGIDVELLSAIAKKEGFQYTLKPMDFSGIIPGLVSGQIDGAMAGMNITEERKKSVDFSTGYATAGDSIVVNANNTSIHQVEDIDGKTVAVKKGTTGAKFAEENKDKYHLNITYFDDSPSMMLAVANGNADFLVEDYPVISYQIRIGAQKGLKVAVDSIHTPPEYGFAVKKDTNAKLMQMFNDGLKKVKEDGTYDKIVGQYLTK